MPLEGRLYPGEGGTGLQASSNPDALSPDGVEQAFRPLQIRMHFLPTGWSRPSGLFKSGCTFSRQGGAGLQASSNPDALSPDRVEQAFRPLQIRMHFLPTGWSRPSGLRFDGLKQSALAAEVSDTTSVRKS